VHLLDNIERNTVVAISTGTGSGKSTLMPALLAADNYDKIFVTQPRRLPCNLLSARVNSCITPISGWAVSGSRSVNATHSPILYLTDGLLKEYLLYREKDIIRQANSARQGIIFFVDEVHERSINIDLCLALLARFLTVHQDMQTKVKVIISSATLGPDVSALFNRFRFHPEKLITPELHTVKTQSSDENMFDLIHRLAEDCGRSDQILCFVKSTLDVNQSIKLLSSIKKRGSSPLVQSQSAAEQERLIQAKQIFFSTTVAETSLTFPSLKYVVDTGVINMPEYKSKEDSTVLQEIPAAESTIKQRQGRLGRTRDGEYFSLYKHNPADKKYPTPQICQSELSNIEFSLRRSPLKQGLNHLKQWLPNPPDDLVIELAIKRLRDLDILDITERFTPAGSKMAQLPDFGSLAMSRAVLAGLETFKCGRDLIRLASILGVLNTSAILRSIPSQFKRAEGDFMTLLSVMNAILARKRIIPPHIFDINVVCKDLGLTSISHNLKRAMLRNTSFESFFNHSLQYRVASETSSNDWCSIAKSLLAGFSNNVYLSQTELQGKLHSFYRYNIYPVRKNQQTIAVIDSSSTLARSLKSIPVSLILVRDIHCSTAIRATSILSFIGEIQADWITNLLVREFEITTNEKQKYENEIKSNSTFQAISKNVEIKFINEKILLTGIAGDILITELYIRKQLISQNKTPLLLDSYGNHNHEGLNRNIADLVNTLYIFNPLKWRWKAEKQVKIIFRKVGNGCEVIVEARDEDFKSVRKELDSFIGWLKDCVALHLHSGIPPRQLKSRSIPIEERIARLTDIKLTSADLWSSVCGPQATRESRMEVVAWTAICKFYCKLEGGFVRDWVVNNTRAQPKTNPSQWVTIGNNKMPYLDQSLIPSDLDCHLPLDRYFDIERFLDEIYKFEIETRKFRQEWRYVLLFDEHYHTGPFTMDLIEPHVALTHNRIDFDVNNLYVERDHTKDLGQRIDLHEPPCSIDLEQTIENIQKKHFRVLRDVEPLIQTRIDKMTGRGWTQYGDTLSFIPAPSDKDTFVEADLPSQTPRYRTIVEDFKKIENARIISIKQLRNPNLENVYEASKILIANECPRKDPNERFLYHGTGADNAKSIMEKGFDNRYFSNFGLYGNFITIYLIAKSTLFFCFSQAMERILLTIQLNHTVTRNRVLAVVQHALCSITKLF
jgi:HrpA-like RNA helicase